MKSIWGNYNRNSPHNFKKNNGALYFGETQVQQLSIFDNQKSKDLAKLFSTPGSYITCDDVNFEQTNIEDVYTFSFA